MIYKSPLKDNTLLKKANNLYKELPVYLQNSVDESPDSGLEPASLPDGYARLRGTLK